MERDGVLKVGKYTSILVMILSGLAVMITAMEGYLNDKDYGQVIIALGVFIVALRNYIKDKYGMI